MKKRLFVAINLDPATKLALARLMTRIPHHPNLARTKIDSLHLTLLFLGETDEELIPTISTELGQISKNFSSLSLKFTELGGFPDIGQPQVLWIGLSGEGLIQLRQTIYQRLIELVPTADAKPFRPHLTLGRAKAHFHPEFTLAGSGIGVAVGDELPLLPVPQIDLMESTLSPGGSVYRKISSHRLEKSI